MEPWSMGWLGEGRKLTQIGDRVFKTTSSEQLGGSRRSGGGSVTSPGPSIGLSVMVTPPAVLGERIGRA